jgi:hypothetical protein
MKVANQTSDMDQIKICLYKVGDKLDWIPVGAGVFVVKRNDAVTWTPPNGEELPEYHMKVFKAQLIDALLAERNVGLNESVAVRGGGNHYIIETV